jgi:hypothetical protein
VYGVARLEGEEAKVNRGVNEKADDRKIYLIVH